MEIILIMILSVAAHIIILLINRNFYNGRHCPICHQSYTLKNIKTKHHILPRRYWQGKVPKIILCRECHNKLESIIRKKEVRLKRELTQKEYCETIVLFLFDFVHQTKTHRNHRKNREEKC